MYPHILHIYGPLWITTYGCMIAIGLSIFCYLVRRDKEIRALITHDQFINLITYTIFGAIIGGRFLYIIEAYQDIDNKWEMLLPWIGGLSIFGSLITCVGITALFFNYHRIPFLKAADAITPYVPLLQSIARLGCFGAGCCFGIEASSHLPWSVMYTHPDSIAPLYIPLHPTQLYLSLGSFTLFLILSYIRSKKPLLGTTTCFFLMGDAIIRFIIEFWRNDMPPYVYIHNIPLTFSQLIAIGICVISSGSYIYLRLNKK